MFAMFTKRFIGRAAITVLAIGALSTAVAPAASAAGWYETSRAGAQIASEGKCGINNASPSTIGGAKEYSITVASYGFEYYSLGVVYQEDGVTRWFGTYSVPQSYEQTFPIPQRATSSRQFVIVGWDLINGQYEPTQQINTYFTQGNHGFSYNPWYC